MAIKKTKTMTNEQINDMIMSIDYAINLIELNYNSDIDDREIIVHNLQQLDNVIDELKKLKL
jgi:hypothetical protein